MKLAYLATGLFAVLAAYWVTEAAAIEEVVVTASRNLIDDPPKGVSKPPASCAHPKEQDASLSPWMVSATRFNVDALDLYAIALQESRRHFPDGQVRPWPWTLHSPSVGSMYFDTCEQAAAKLTELIAQGIRNIDVGLMQISWHWNGHRVSDPVDLLNPTENIDVAAEILRENLDQFGGDVRIAIARYHSAKIENGIPYAAAVLTIRRQLDSLSSVKLALAL